jgi:hypothetical protein
VSPHRPTARHIGGTGEESPGREQLSPVDSTPPTVSGSATVRNDVDRQSRHLDPKGTKYAYQWLRCAGAFNEQGQYSNWEIGSSSASQQAFANAIASPYYAPGGNYGNLPLLSKIQPLS